MRWLTACLLVLAGCAEEPPPEPAPAPTEAPESVRSAEELEPAEPLDPVETSGGFHGARHQEASRIRQTEPARAARLYEGACDRGFAPSCLALADMLEAGEGVDADPDRARGLREQACMEGSTLACDRLGH